MKIISTGYTYVILLWMVGASNITFFLVLNEILKFVCSIWERGGIFSGILVFFCGLTRWLKEMAWKFVLRSVYRKVQSRGWVTLQKWVGFFVFNRNPGSFSCGRTCVSVIVYIFRTALSLRLDKLLLWLESKWSC